MRRRREEEGDTFSILRLNAQDVGGLIEDGSSI
jgi:hypothetical protein